MFFFSDWLLAALIFPPYSIHANSIFAGLQAQTLCAQHGIPSSRTAKQQALLASNFCKWNDTCKWMSYFLVTKVPGPHAYNMPDFTKLKLRNKIMSLNCMKKSMVFTELTGKCKKLFISPISLNQGFTSRFVYNYRHNGNFPSPKYLTKKF